MIVAVKVVVAASGHGPIDVLIGNVVPVSFH